MPPVGVEWALVAGQAVAHLVGDWVRKVCCSARLI